MYCDVTALGVATWTCAILSLYYARIKSKPISKVARISGSDDPSNKGSPDAIYHAFSNPGKDPLLSQDEMRILYQNLRALREAERYEVDPQTHPGLEIKSVLLHALGDFRENRGPLSKFALEAFPEAAELFEYAVFAFERGAVVIDCVPVSAMSRFFRRRESDQLCLQWVPPDHYWMRNDECSRATIEHKQLLSKVGRVSAKSVKQDN
jgi:hypothetical protein